MCLWKRGNLMKYVNLHELNFSDAEIVELIRNDVRDVLIELPIRLGFCHENWKFIQDICVQLSEHPDEIIRGNSFYGLMYAAMNHRKLEKNIVKPVLLRGLQDRSELVRSRLLTLSKILITL